MRLDKHIYDLPSKEGVICVSNIVVRDPSFHDYRQVLRFVYLEIEAELRKWLYRGFQPHVFLIGAALTQKMIADIPHYDLWGAPKKIGLDHIKRIEIDVYANDHRRRVGLYQIREGEIFDACFFQTQSSQCVIILLPPDVNASENLCREIYIENETCELERIAPLKWRNIAKFTCEFGSLVLKTIGMFDDIERGIIMCLPKSESQYVDGHSSYMTL